MKITDSIKIKDLELNTRIVMPPMATSKSQDGMIGDDMVEYYRLRAENPLVSLIITEHSYIAKEGIANPRQVSISSDEDIEQLKKIVNAVHGAGKKIFAQINHAGKVGKNPYELLDVDTMSKDDIDRIRTLFVDAAVRAYKAGYDGVEVHSAHSYLLNQFYSPLTNHRTDEYSAENIENRIRLHKEILEEIHEKLPDYPVSLRLGGCDYMEGGSTIEDAVEASMQLESLIDLLSITGGMCIYQRKDNKDPGYFSDMSSAVKAKVSVPVLLTGGIKTTEDAERLLNEGAADLIGIGRALLINAEWPNAKKA